MKSRWEECLTNSRVIAVGLLAMLILSLSVAMVEAEVGVDDLLVEWQQFLPAISGEDIIQTPDGGYLVLGTNASLSHEGVYPIYLGEKSVLVRTDESGNLLW